MKKLLLALPLLLAACGSDAADITLTANGVTMADLEKIRGEISGLKGVRDVKAGQFKEGQATFAVKFEGKGPDLAARLATLGSGLKNVKGFDDVSIQIAYGAVEEKPVPVKPAPAAVAAPEAPAKAAVAPEKPAAPTATPAPTVTPATPAVPAAEEGKEVKVDTQKDPLAYKVHQLPGGSIATFDGWKITPMQSDSTWTVMETHPEGKENDFQMIVSAGTPGREVMNNLFEEATKYIQQMMPAIKPVGEAKKTTFGGDEARIQDYTLEANGKTLKVQSIIIRKKDVAVSVTAFGNDESFKEYGRAPGIVAQSITIKEEPPDRALVGTWLLEKYTSTGAGTSNAFSHSSSCSMTIYPNGTFTENSSSMSSLSNNVGKTDAYLDGGNRGRVVKRGTTLSFTYDNGKVWNTEFKMDGGAVWFGKNLWMKQQ